MDASTPPTRLWGRKRDGRVLGIMEPDSKRAKPTIPTGFALVSATSNIYKIGDQNNHLPATIDFESGCPTSPQQGSTMWEHNKAGKLAADRKMMAFRHAGSIRLSFNITASYEATSETLPENRIVDLFKKAIRKSKRLTKKRTDMFDVWNTYGEPGQDGPVVTVDRLLSGISKNILDSSANDHHLLLALSSFIDPRSLWKVPLLRVIVRGAQTGPSQLSCTLHVYFNRLIFYLISNESLALIMSRLTPAGEVSEPIEVPPSRPKVFHKSRYCENDDDKIGTQNSKSNSERDSESDDELDPFSLDGVLRDAESHGYKLAQQPDDVELNMKNYQRMSLQFMIDREHSNRGLNGYFWETWTWRDGGEFYYSPRLGELRIGEDKPPIVHGGLLCDEMGMGKTLVVGALMARDKMLPNFQNSETRQTLIVAPATLVRQWERELRKSTPSLKVMTYEMNDVVKGPSNVISLLRASKIEIIRSFDVIVTSYSVLLQDKTFNLIKWRRIALDEMQEIRSSTTKLARRCASLESDYRWMVSGTPLYTSIYDLHGELAFLKVVPFSLLDSTDGFFAAKIGRPWSNKDPDAHDLVQELLSNIMIRHSKNQKTLSGDSILELPSITTKTVPVSMRHSERAVLMFLESIGHKLESRAGFIDVDTGHRGGHWSLQLLQLMRDCCMSINMLTGGAGCHSQLVKLDRFIRRTIDNVMVDASDAEFKKATAAEARDILMQAEAIGASARGAGASSASSSGPTERDFRDLGINDDFVRHSDVFRRNYASNRSFAMESAKERLKVLDERANSLAKTISQKSRLPKFRWKWALASMRCGMYCPTTIEGLDTLSLKLFRKLVSRIKLNQRIENLQDAVLSQSVWAEHVQMSDLISACASHVDNQEELIGKPRSYLTRVLLAEPIRHLADSKSALAKLSSISYETIDRDYHLLVDKIALATTQLESLTEYRKVLVQAQDRDQEELTRQNQDRFQGLNEIVEGLPAPQCPICLCEPAEDPVVTPCVHMYCKKCFIAHLNASKVLDGPIASGHSSHSVRCPLCRRQCNIGTTIELVDSAQNGDHNAIQGAEDEVEVEAANSSSPSSEDAIGKRGLKYTSAATEEQYDAMAVPSGYPDIPAGRLARFPALPQSLLAHFVASGGNLQEKTTFVPPVWSSKAVALLKCLADIQSENINSKVVVFSSSKETICYLTTVLLANSIESVRIMRGDSIASQEMALDKFNTTSTVLLLHAGTAAAGLTLTMAQNVILMEPFLKIGEELQAMNRCHRIGQEKPVTCVTLYIENSIEERLLFKRQNETSVTNHSQRGMDDKDIRLILGLRDIESDED